MIKYGYHSTNADPEKIKTDGFDSNNETALNFNGDKFYNFKEANIQIPKNPCWIFNAKVGAGYAEDNDYCLKINIAGLKLWPDLNYFPTGKQKGKFLIVEESSWLKKCYNVFATWLEKKAEKITIDGKQYYKVDLKTFNGEESFNYIGSAIIDGDKVKDRIVDYISNI